MTICFSFLYKWFGLFACILFFFSFKVLDRSLRVDLPRYMVCFFCMKFQARLSVRNISLSYSVLYLFCPIALLYFRVLHEFLLHECWLFLFCILSALSLSNLFLSLYCSFKMPSFYLSFLWKIFSIMAIFSSIPFLFIFIYERGSYSFIFIFWPYHHPFQNSFPLVTWLWAHLFLLYVLIS